MSTFPPQKVPYYWHFARLNASYSPVLSQGQSETILNLIDNVGLYQGSYKITNRQKGRLYVTNERLIYVDDEDPLNLSVYVRLRDVAGENAVKVYNGFLKSSPKITVRFKEAEEAEEADELEYEEAEAASEAEESKATKEAQVSAEAVDWKCKICSFVNTIRSDEYDFQMIVDPSLRDGTVFPRCAKCGMPSNKNGIANAVKKSRKKRGFEGASSASSAANQCPVCTFINHPAMSTCEVCGAPLKKPLKSSRARSAVNNVIFMETEDYEDGEINAFSDYSIKICFRGSSSTITASFLKSLAATIQRSIVEVNLKIINESAMKNENVKKIIFDKQPNDISRSSSGARINSGIHALEKNQREMLDKYDMILGSSLEDLNSLMSKAKELNDLIKSFDRVLNSSKVDKAKYKDTLNESKKVLGIGSTNESFNRIILSNNFNFLNKLDNKDVFYRELARNLSTFILEYVFANANKTVSQLVTTEYSGGIISLIDLYSLYNRSLGFNSNLISPTDLLESCKKFEALRLPLRFRKFERTGTMVIQNTKSSDEDILNRVGDLLVAKKFESQTESYHRGIGVQTLVREMNLSGGILTEILEIGLERGMLLIDEDISGVSYYLNEIVDIGEAAKDLSSLQI